MTAFDELKKISPATAIELDLEFALMAPPPLGENPTKEETAAFEAQLRRAEEIIDAKAEECLKNIRH